jgi:hypothetical protein
MNVDYAVCEALKYRTDSLPGSVIYYDVACGWIIHFLERVNEGEYLELPEGMKNMIGAVGKCHTPIGGRCMMTLCVIPIGRSWWEWVSLTLFLRLMEIFNSRFIHIVRSLVQKHKKAVAGLHKTQEAFEGLTKSISEDLIEEWTASEKQAMRERGDALEIFNVKEKSSE